MGLDGFMETISHIAKAIEIAGSQVRLGELSGLSQQFISKLATGQRAVTAETAMAIDKATNGGVSKSILRPDLWPDDGSSNFKMGQSS